MKPQSSSVVKRLLKRGGSIEKNPEAAHVVQRSSRRVPAFVVVLGHFQTLQLGS